jgi:hypothetical protein
VEPATLLFGLLTNARDAACANQEAQVGRVARSLQREREEVIRRLEDLVDHVEVRVTRSLAVAGALLARIIQSLRRWAAGRGPPVRSLGHCGRDCPLRTHRPLTPIREGTATGCPEG